MCFALCRLWGWHERGMRYWGAVMKYLPLTLPSFDELLRRANRLQLGTVSRWLGLGAALGVLSGLIALGFYAGMSWLSQVVLDGWVNLELSEPAGEARLFERTATGSPVAWLLVITPGVGGLLSGWLVTRFAPEAEGHGTDSLIHAFHEGEKLRKRIPLIKGLASLIVLGTGGSAGREGPIAQISGAVGQMLGRPLRLSERETRLLLLAGAAGGIGAIFRTPLGAALFVIEVLYRDDTEVDAFVPAVLTSVVSYSTFTAVVGEGAMFAVVGDFSFSPRQIPLYVLMAMVCGLVGVLYVKVFYGMRNRIFSRLPVPRAIRPAIGGLCVGGLALLTPHALGAGYGVLQDVLTTSERIPGGWYAPATLLGLALLKVLTTSLSVSSGGSGGVFGPTVVIGGLVGGAVGYAMHYWFPGTVPHPSAFALVGMACFIGGVAHAPVSTLVMATEMTGSYELLVPLMLAEAVTFVMLRPWTLYERQVASRKESEFHWADHYFDTLKQLSVRQAFQGSTKVSTVHEATPLDAILREASQCSQDVIPVVDSNGKPSGLTSLDSLRAFMFEEGMGAIVVAHDCQHPFVSLYEDETLSTAVERFLDSGLRQLPVVERVNPNQIVGFLSYEDVLTAYDHELQRRGLKSTPKPTVLVMQ